MKNTTEYQQKKILVLGLAKSGVAAANLLHKLGAEVTVNDRLPIEENEAGKALQEVGIKVICGGHPIEILDDHFDVIVKNPGIPYNNPLVLKALDKEIPIITEIELGYHVSEADFIGITGSNGKTTTTTLLFDILKQGKKQPLIAGNIGTVACEVAQTASSENLIVTELSSFQLMGIEEFRPKIAILLNIFDAHIDYHGSRKNYVNAKGQLFKNQTEEDYCILNADDEEVLSLGDSNKAKKVLFSTKQVLKEGTYIKDNCIYYNQDNVLSLKDIALPGKHNLENIMAALSAAKILGVDNETIRDVLHVFTGVKHRLQYVETIAGRKFYNDSKATNILATKKAITAFAKPVILLAGGLDRGNEFDELIPELKNVKTLITFGQTASKLERAAKLAGIESIQHVDNVEHAVNIAYELSIAGDVVLLSPACASWDQYKTFEERGDMFIDAVHKLK
ncbi:UDP-N-acetylmuramoyl-L-alanine--D-glutamate ligase [Cytobacillus sp. S13-E01]|uniref:UDP-N-acetylmuramoyl-L-alanine--D-glutamate ligase n=1 Tax=Cytobacillus sp. S13-E01 TaxID=3031326 RepID=UPI0023D82728|nr:UDP-N-acetylmuramoyl-L-alanine--D-glutamate ligase [Cytobacillus sp. S13-E01]MDF0725279.1 UDP-N-acetylmuramoyl-L-alanine--D-glutamate ligase [Cytobacillus sp. S13-E01]